MGSWEGGGASIRRIYPDTGNGASEDVFNLLAVRVSNCGDGTQEIESDIPFHSPALPLRNCGELYKDNWWGFNTQNADIDNVV